MKAFLIKQCSVFLFCFFALNSILFSQIKPEYDDKFLKANYEQAKHMLENQNFPGALELFLLLDNAFPGNSNINYQIGFCYMHIRGKRKQSIPYLEKALQNVSFAYSGNYFEKTAPYDTYFLLGAVYHITYNFQEAIESYNKYLEYILPFNPDIMSVVVFEIAKCYNAKEMLNNPVSIKIENLGAKINSEYPDYSPIISADKNFLIFTSRRKAETSSHPDESGLYNENMYISKKVNDEWGQAQLIPGKINTSGNEASVSLSHDEQRLFIFKADKGIGNIYVSKFENNNWTKPEKLPSPVNSKYNETHVSLSADGRTLYFVSDRPGGYGGRDIYKSLYLGDNKWDIPENLGPTINTKYNEESPFILFDGVTLYFSSEGHENMGGFDIFSSTISEDGFWKTPENIGYPINTTEDDFFFYMTADEKNAVFSTSRQLRGMGDIDIYYLTIVKPKKEYVCVRGKIADKINLEPVIATLTIKNSETGEIIAKFITDKNEVNFKSTLPKDNKYILEVEAKGYKTTTKEIYIRPDEKISYIDFDILLSK